MFTENTVFVLGAGSSYEVGLPLGQELINQIIDDVGYDVSGNGSKFRNRDFASFIANEFNIQFSDVSISHKLMSALPHAKSIDNYIATNIEDEKLVSIVKASIVHRILLAERESILFTSHGDDRKWNVNEINKSWFSLFFHKLVDGGISFKQLPNIFANLTIINFNYDRCLEQFLTYTLAGYFGKPAEETFELVKTLRIERPYGKIGNYTLSNSSIDGVGFGSKVDYSILGKLSNNINTFSEGANGISTLEECQSVIEKANKIIFLGLAFHEANMPFFSMPPLKELPRHDLDSPQLFATAFEMSKFNTEAIQNNLQSIIPNRQDTITSATAKAYVENLSCYKMLSDFDKLI